MLEKKEKKNTCSKNDKRVRQRYTNITNGFVWIVEKEEKRW